jgi:hypothetical protein
MNNIGHPHRYYVKAIYNKRGSVKGYGVYDCIGGLESQHAIYMIRRGLNASVALALANEWRDDLNAKNRNQQNPS